MTNQTKQKNIAIIEEDVATRNILEFILNQYQYTPSLFKRRKLFLKQLTTQNYDFIFLDANQNDPSLMTDIKLLCQNYKETPIILMSNFTAHKLIKRCYEMGVYALLFKPFDIMDIKSIINCIDELEK